MCAHWDWEPEIGPSTFSLKSSDIEQVNVDNNDYSRLVLENP